MVIRRHGVRYRWVTLGGFDQVSCVTRIQSGVTREAGWEAR
jgi:hypothetical protein